MRTISRTFDLLLVVMLLTLFMSSSTLMVQAATAWSVKTVDINGFDLSHGGVFPIAVDSSNNPHIAYTDVENAGSLSPPEETYPLMYASWTGSRWVIQNVSQGFVNSLALDSHNNPHIAYEATNGGLMYASWTGLNWTVQTVDPQGNYASLVLDSEGNPHIAYTDGNTLKYAIWTASNWTIQTVDTSQFPFKVCLALNSNNSPFIMYYASGEVKLAVYGDSNWNIQTVISNVTSFGNMVLDSEGSPHFIYSANNTLLYASWNGITWNTQNVTSNIDEGGLGSTTGFLTTASLALDSHNFPHIAYVKNSPGETGPGWGFLAYASWNGTSWNIQTINSQDIAESCFLCLDSNGTPNISIIGVNLDSAAYAGETYGPYDYTASVIYATVTEPAIILSGFQSLLVVGTIAVIAVIIISLLLYRRHRKNR